MSDDEILGFRYLLLVGGNDTTTNLIGNRMRLLADHPAGLDEREFVEPERVRSVWASGYESLNVEFEPIAR